MKAGYQRPRDLAGRMAGRLQASRLDGYKREMFRLPRSQARDKVRDLLRQYPQEAYMTAVESWRELPDDIIEFTVRRLPSAD